MELLVLKIHDQYLRILENDFELTTINKASVYPIKEKDRVLQMYDRIRSVEKDLIIRKLVLTETDFDL